MRTIALALFTSLALAALVTGARADCLSECSVPYEAAMAACQAAPSTDPTGTDTLQNCMDDAQEAYGRCQQECTEKEDE